MSSQHGPARARTPRPGTPQPRLNVVPRPAPKAARAPFVALMVVLVGAGLVGLLVLNTAMQNRAFALKDLQQQVAELGARQAALQLQVDRRASPQRLAREAGALGMVPNSSPVFLRLRDGKVIGEAVPAVAGTNLPGIEPPGPTPLEIVARDAAAAAKAAEQKAAEQKAAEQKAAEQNNQQQRGQR